MSLKIQTIYIHRIKYKNIFKYLSHIFLNNHNIVVITEVN